MDSHLRAREERFQNKIKRNAPSRRVLRRDNSRAGKGWALQCKHNFANKCVYDVFVSFFLLMVFPRNLYQTNRIFDLCEKISFLRREGKKKLQPQNDFVDTRRNLYACVRMFWDFRGEQGRRMKKTKEWKCEQRGKEVVLLLKESNRVVGILSSIILILIILNSQSSGDTSG